MRREFRAQTEYDPVGYPPAATAQPYYAAGYPPVKIKKPNRGMMRLFVFLIIIAAALIILQTVFFRLQTVYIIGNETISADYIASITGLEKGDNIFTVSEDNVRDCLNENHWIVLEHMYKKYPGEVYLFIHERESVATMQWLGIQYTLDIEGMVLKEYAAMNYEGDVPVVYGFGVSKISVGDYLGVRTKAQLTAYSSIVSELTIQRYEDQIESINVSDPEALSLHTASNITVQLGNSDYMRAKIGAMRTDIAYLQQLGETSGVLDISTPEDGKFRRE